MLSDRSGICGRWHMRDSVIGYMDKTDFDHELGHTGSGNLVYPSIIDLQRQRKCWEECGIVEVEVRLVRVVVPTDLREGEKEDAAV